MKSLPLPKHADHPSSCIPPLVEFPKIEKLQRGVPSESRSMNEVPLPKPSRLLDQAKEPLEAALAHPRRRLFHSPYVEVKGGPHAYKDRNSEPVTEFCHPAFLLRCAQAYPDDIRISGPDTGYDFCFLCFSLGAKRGRADADHAVPIPLFQHFGQALRYATRTAI